MFFLAAVQVSAQTICLLWPFTHNRCLYLQGPATTTLNSTGSMWKGYVCSFTRSCPTSVPHFLHSLAMRSAQAAGNKFLGHWERMHAVRFEKHCWNLILLWFFALFLDPKIHFNKIESHRFPPSRRARQGCQQHWRHCRVTTRQLSLSTSRFTVVQLVSEQTLSTLAPVADVFKHECPVNLRYISPARSSCHWQSGDRRRTPVCFCCFRNVSSFFCLSDPMLTWLIPLPSINRSGCNAYIIVEACAWKYEPNISIGLR